MTYTKLVKSIMRRSRGQSCTINANRVEVRRRLDSANDHHKEGEQRVDEALCMCVCGVLLGLCEKGK